MEIVERNEPSMEDKLAKPTFWGKVVGLTVQELKPDMFDDCLKLIERHLVPEEAMCVALDMKSDPASAAALLAGAKECMRDGTSVVVFKGEDYVEEDSHAAGEGLADDNLDDATDRDPPVLRAGSGAKEVIERPRAAVGEEFDHEEGRRQLPGGHDEVEAEVVERGSEASGKAAEGGLDGTATMEVEKDEDESGTDEDSDQEDEEEMKRRRERKRRRHKRKWAGRKREQQAEAGDGEGEQWVAGDDDGEDGDAQTQQVDDEEEAEPRVVGVLVARVVQRLEHMRSFSRVKVVQGDAYQKWLALRCHLQRTANLFEEFGVDAYYRVYHIVVHPAFRRKGVGSFLVRLAAQRLADLFSRPSRQGPGALCTAVAPSRAAQRLLARQGFRPQLLVNYHEWKDEAGQPVISGAGVGNYNVALVVHQAAAREPGEAADVSPLEPLQPEESEAAAAVETVSPLMTFPGQGWPLPPSPQCPPAHEEPPFGVAVAASSSRPGPPIGPPTAPMAPTAPSVASSGTSGTPGRGGRGGIGGADSGSGGSRSSGSGSV